MFDAILPERYGIRDSFFWISGGFLDDPSEVIHGHLIRILHSIYLRLLQHTRQRAFQAHSQQFMKEILNHAFQGVQSMFLGYVGGFLTYSVTVSAH